MQLDELAVHCVPFDQWSCLSIHLQQYLFPVRYHSAFQRLQRRWRAYRRWRMEVQLEFKTLLHRQDRIELLLPDYCVVYSNSLEWSNALKPGDHIVVYTDIVFHHGIFIGNNEVIHVINKQPASQLCSLIDFIAMVGKRDELYGIVKHILPDAVTEEAFRHNIVQYAQHCLVHSANSDFLIYDELTNNCEHFVWWVFTGGIVKYPSSINIARMAISTDDLRFATPLPVSPKPPKQSHQTSLLLREELIRKRGEFGTAHMIAIGLSATASSHRTTCTTM